MSTTPLQGGGDGVGASGDGGGDWDKVSDGIVVVMVRMKIRNVSILG